MSVNVHYLSQSRFYFYRLLTHYNYRPQVCCSLNVMMHFRTFGEETMSLFPCQHWMVVVGSFWSISLYDECMLVIMQVEEMEGGVSLAQL